MLQGLENLCFGDIQLRDKKLLRGQFWHLLGIKGGYKKTGRATFTWADSDRSSGKGFKLKESWVRLDKRKNIFTVRVIKH